MFSAAATLGCTQLLRSVREADVTLALSVVDRPTDMDPGEDASQQVKHALHASQASH